MAGRMSREKIVIKTGEYNKDVHNMIKLSEKQKKEFTEQMKVFAQNFLKTNFDLDLKIPIEISGRLTRTGGSFHFNTNLNMALRIKMSERFIACALLDDDGIEAILDILKHELVHYAMFKQGKQYNDGSNDFESALAKLNIGASGATSESKILTKKENVWYSLLDIYNCPITEKQYENRHTQKAINWIGKRTGYKIVKSYF